MRKLHPALKAHGQKVKAAHAHLATTQTGFLGMPVKERMKAVQTHIRKGTMK